MRWTSITLYIAKETIDYGEQKALLVWEGAFLFYQVATQLRVDYVTSLAASLGAASQDTPKNLNLCMAPYLIYIANPSYISEKKSNLSVKYFLNELRYSFFGMPEIQEKISHIETSIGSHFDEDIGELILLARKICK